MNKKLKYFSLILVSNLLITGCSNQQEVTSNNINDIKKDNVVKQENIKYLSKEDIYGSINFENYEVNNLEKITLNSPIIPVFSAKVVAGPAVKIIANNVAEIKLIDLSYIIDSYNKYNKGVYNDLDVLEDIMKRLENNKYYAFSKKNSKSSDYTEEELKDFMAIENTIVYFEGDKKFLSNVQSAIIPNDEVVEMSEKVLEEDTLIIPVINVKTKEKVASYYLKYNDKVYLGGKEKSKFYIYDYK